MINLIRVEFFKLRKNRSYWVLLIALAVLSMAYPLLYYFDHRSSGEAQFTGAVFLTTFVASNAYLIKFGVAMLAGFFICNEYATGVMKTIASSGHTRGRLFIAKLCGFTGGAFLVSLAFPVVSTITVSGLAGFGHLPAGSTAFLLVRIIGLTLLYAAAYAAIAALFAVVLTDSGKTIGASLAFFLLADVALAGIGSKVPFMAKVYDYSIFKQIGDIGKPVIEHGEWPSLVLVPLVTLAVCALLGVLAFRRKDIK